ncbi:MAG: M28 family peptidase [Acidobacteria bacterium]|nr:M28 family peptidase [Acidobacteriota bacterium]
MIQTLLLLALAQAGAQPPRAPGNELIRAADLKADLHFLAGDWFRGRLTGNAENLLAARYIESRFARLGLKPGGVDGTYFHNFDLVAATLGKGNRLVVHPQEGAAQEAELRQSFVPMLFSADGKARGQAVFAGFGILAPKLNWDDYKGLDVKGKVAVVLTSEPGANDPASRFDGLVTSDYANTLSKTLWAQERGAIALVFVDAGQVSRGTNSFAAAARSQWPDRKPHLERYTLSTQADRIHIPAVQVSPSIARQILGGADIAALAKQSEKARAPVVGVPVEVETSLDRRIVADRSVVAVLEGSDAKLKDEAILISAHYDHNGADGTSIFNGADDNGSGAVALMAIAEAYKRAADQGQRPRRSIIFASWGSEERCCGPLLGAWAWIENPLWPLHKTVAALNMDMIGRSEEVPESGGPRFNGLKAQTAASNANAVNIMGYSFSPDLAAGARAANRDIDLTLRLRYDNNRSQLLRRSDQWPFLQRGVPALFFHTGLHPDYHTVNDRPERIDYTKVERVGRLVHQLSWTLAQQDGRPAMANPRMIPQPD